MALVEKLRREDFYFYEIMRNPVLFTEFIANIDRLPVDEEFTLTEYQKDFACDFSSYVDICTARATGKSEMLSWILKWALIFNLFPQDYIVYTVPNKVHLEPVFTKLIRNFRSNSFLKNFIEPKGGINSADFTVKLLNNTNLMCRIAGQSGTGANVIGLHSPFEVLDEGGYYPWGTWLEFQPTLNTWTPGFRLTVAGVPTGLRENNVLYHTDQENSNYSKHNVSALQNPRFSDDSKTKAIEDYGGEDSDDYVHFVLGKHGRPIFSLFDRSLLSVQNYPVYQLKIDGMAYGSNLTEYLNKLSVFPGLQDRTSTCIMGIDLGYTEPTAIVILYTDHYGRLKFHGRIQLTKVSYPIQEKIIDLLDSRFNPAIIGIDRGSAGISVIQNLQEGKDYLHKNYAKRVVPVDFSSSIVLGIDSSGNEIKSKTKPFSVSVLQDYCNNHKLSFSTTDLEMISELERMTYSKTPTGDIVYKTLTVKGGKKGEDHFTSAILCAILSYYLYNEFILNRPEKVKLAGASWLIGV